jgi:TolA-binding protein
MRTSHILALTAVCTAAILLPVLPVAPAAAQGSSASGVKDLLASLWARLRAATPRSSAAAPVVTVTAGLRGEEATESELRPYWRGDREQDPSSRNERVALEAAQALADAGKFAEAAQAFEAFLQANPHSTLAANAVFGAALARAAMGDRARATAGFQDFLKREPQHPLAEDARQALAALR